jgi:hypothetical protein
MPTKYYTIEEAIERMKATPGLKMTMPQHYRSFEYNYYDEKSGKFLTERGEEWDIRLSRHYNELTGYADVEG